MKPKIYIGNEKFAGIYIGSKRIPLEIAEKVPTVWEVLYTTNGMIIDSESVTAPHTASYTLDNGSGLSIELPEGDPESVKVLDKENGILAGSTYVPKGGSHSSSYDGYTITATYNETHKVSLGKQSS